MIKSFFIVNKQKFLFVFMMLLLAVLIIPLQGRQDINPPLDITYTPYTTSLSSSMRTATPIQESSLLNYQATSSPTLELLSSTKSQADTILSQKTVYLTFDDGPSKLTSEVLDILKESNIHATFFVLGEQVKRFPELVTRVIEEGHALGNHSYNHNYEELYKGFSPFWSQIKQTEEAIRSVTGLHTSLVRAPGGTAGHFDDTYFKLLKEGGYQVVDWNVDSGDSKRRGVPARDIIKDATTHINSDEVVVLMHDGNGHAETVKSLPKIISYYKEKGYKFEVLTPELPKLETFQFKVTKSARALQRPQPNEEWIATNVLPNAALFSHGKRLVMEIGRMETDFKEGAYRISDGKIMVPLRTMMDKIGVNVRWDVNNKLAIIDTSLNSLQISVATGDWTIVKKGTISQTMNVPVQMNGDTLWVPLREILSATGHNPISIKLSDEEWRIRTL